LKCLNCPYAQEDLRVKFDLFEKTGEPYNTRDMEEYVWCDKVGGRVSYFGGCTDFYNNEAKKDRHYNRRKRKGKRERNLKHKAHLVKISRACPNRVFLKTWTFDYQEEKWVEDQTPYYTRIYRKHTRYDKRYANHLVRKYVGYLAKGNSYRKLYLI
jgi:hypothetical protein